MERHDSGRRRRGFTLIELLLVIVIIATLAALVIPNFMGRGEEARRTAAKAQITTFESVLATYESDCGSLPESLDSLINEPSPKPRGWKGPYMKDVPVDPWGNPYAYKKAGSHRPPFPDICSNGPDGREGTEDDITSWDSGKK